MLGVEAQLELDLVAAVAALLQGDAAVRGPLEIDAAVTGAGYALGGVAQGNFPFLGGQLTAVYLN